MVQVQPENTPTRTGGGATAASGDLDGSGSGSGDGRRDQGSGGSAHSSALVSSGAPTRRARAGSGAKENQERRAKLLADLGDGTVLVSWANTGVEEASDFPSPCVVHRDMPTARTEILGSLGAGHNYSTRVKVFYVVCWSQPSFRSRLRSAPYVPILARTLGRLVVCA